VECLTRCSYSSCGAVSSHVVDIGNVVDVAVVDRDSDAIRYESWKFVFADYVIVDGSEGFDYCAKLASLLVYSDCCCSTTHAAAMVLGPRRRHCRSSDRSIYSRRYYCDNSPLLCLFVFTK